MNPAYALPCVIFDQLCIFNVGQQHPPSRERWLSPVKTAGQAPGTQSKLQATPSWSTWRRHWASVHYAQATECRHSVTGACVSIPYWIRGVQCSSLTTHQTFGFPSSKIIHSVPFKPHDFAGPVKHERKGLLPLHKAARGSPSPLPSASMGQASLLWAPPGARSVGEQRTAAAHSSEIKGTCCCGPA